MKKYIGKFTISDPYGFKSEIYSVRPKKGYFKSEQHAAKAASKVGSIRLHSDKYPIGSVKIASSESVNEISKASKPRFY